MSLRTIRPPGHPLQFINTAPNKLTIPDGVTDQAVTLVSTDATQTISGKTLTSPTITTPTITNPTISGQTPVNVTAASVTLGATHVGRVVTLNRATGIVVNLPLATGTGSKYELFVATTFTGTANVVTGQATDVMAGTALLFQDAADTVVGFNATNATTMSMFATDGRNGGIKGARVILTDVATNLWAVQYTSDAANSESTPFS
jgi:hypothetical protein